MKQQSKLSEKDSILSEAKTTGRSYPYLLGDTEFLLVYGCTREDFKIKLTSKLNTKNIS
jgi:hypothetical protein